jgi:metal-dependent amidase/aminoacylase/carboxypeptidase family protein
MRLSDVFDVYLARLDGYPATVNNSAECFALVQRAGAATVGAHRTGKPQKSPGAEDFSFFLEQRPGK